MKFGRASSLRAKIKINKYRARVAPDVFQPAIIEAHGFMHKGLKTYLFGIAETLIREANMSNGEPELSQQQLKTLLGIKINQLYQQVSTCLQKAISKNLDKASSFILAHRIASRPRINRKYTILNALIDIGNHERYANNALSQFI